ncbi:endonuclease dU [Acidihalobacter prosperus]
MKRLTHVVGFDDAPFARSHRGDVLVVGAVFAATRLEGVVSTRVRRDGVNATRKLVDCLRSSRFLPQLQAVLLQGIAFAGFNVVDLRRLHAETGLPVLVVARRAPDLDAIRRALLERVPGGARKWRLIEQAGPMEPLAGLHVQRCGLGSSQAEALLCDLQVNGRLPEPLRTAHLMAGGVATGESRHRP